MILKIHIESFTGETPVPRCRGLEVVGGVFRAEGALEPQGSAQIVRAGSGPCAGQPLSVNGKRFVGIYINVVVAVVGSRSLEADLAVPAVHAAERVRLPAAA